MAGQITLTIIVNGRPTTVEVAENAPLHSTTGKALEQTGNQGQPISNWEFKDAAGNPIPSDRPARDFVGQTIYLDLRRGVGG